MQAVGNPKVTLEFGVPGSRWSAGYHTGRDYAATLGAPVRATWRGRVVRVRFNDVAYGHHVAIESDNPPWPEPVRHWYCHLDSIEVTEGTWVNPGRILGRAGDTGNATAPHLHYEERTPPFGYLDHRAPELELIPWRAINVAQAAESFTREPGEYVDGSSLKLHPDNTRLMQEALRFEGVWAAGTLSGHVSYALRDGYRRFEQMQGWSPTGVPSREGVRRLGVRWGFIPTP